MDYYSKWFDIDKSLIDYNVNLEKTKRWPIDNNTFDLVFTFHVLEHLSDKAVRNTLLEAKRVTRPSGVIRISVPDIHLANNHYKNRNIEWFTKVRPFKEPQYLYSSRHGMEKYSLEEYLLAVFATHLTNARLEGTTDEHCVDFKTVRDDFSNLKKHDFFQKYSNKVKDS